MIEYLLNEFTLKYMMMEYMVMLRGASCEGTVNALRHSGRLL